MTWHKCICIFIRKCATLWWWWWWSINM